MKGGSYKEEISRAQLEKEHFIKRQQSEGDEPIVPAGIMRLVDNISHDTATSPWLDKFSTVTFLRSQINHDMVSNALNNAKKSIYAFLFSLSTHSNQEPLKFSRL
jgi:hypothetical protein